jgi:predicted permease
VNPFRWLRLRLRAIAGRRALERDMQEEMRQHIEQAAERYAARGLTPDEAREAAMREFGNVALLQEQARDARGVRWIETLAADLRFAVRYFARQPMMAATIVLVLALGIGVNSALFSVIQAFTMRPAPAVPDDAARVRIHGLEQATRGAPWESRGFSHPEVEALAERKEVFADVAAWMGHDVIIGSDDSIGARGIAAEFVTPNYFSALRVRLVAGPGFGMSDAGTPDMAAVLSFSLAEELFDTPQAAVGRVIRVNEMPVRIVGVAPPRFQGAIPNGPMPAIWLPISARAEIARVSPTWLSEGGKLRLFARLNSSVSREQATAVADAIARRALPDSAARQGVTRSASVLGMNERPPSTEPDDDILAVFGAGFIALLILLVACTSVSSLLISAALARRHEIAVRLSLGASRRRLLRQLLTESALLAVTAGTLGLLVYWWLIEYITNRASGVNVQLGPDLTTVLVTLVIALGTGILFGLSPALHTTRADVASALRDSAAGIARRTRLQRAFVIAQIVISQPILVMLAVTLLLLNQEVPSENPTAANHVMAATFRPLYNTGAPNQRQEAVDSLARRLAEVPGVTAVLPDPHVFAISSVVPSGSAGDSVTKSPSAVSIQVLGATPLYFDLVDVPILLGRDIAPTDTAGDEIAVVIGSDLARAVWPGANPIGQTLSPMSWSAGSTDSAVMRVVGIYDAERLPLEDHSPRAFTAHGQHWRGDALLIRTRGPAQAMLPTIRTTIRREAPGLPLTELVTYAAIEARIRKDMLVVTAATAGGGALALGLASIGLYGIVSIAVRQRRREIGIRIAVGASPAGVARMFLASGMRIGLIALGLGLPISVVGLRVVLSQESVLAPPVNVWLVGLCVGAALVLVAAFATWLPARRAARVDPAHTLRIE